MNKKVQNNIQNTVAQSNRAQKSNNQNVENQGTIVYTVPNGSYSENTVLVKNTTGRDISSGLLNEYLRPWIMEGQNGCEGICDATGTLWEKLWLDKVPDETIINAFIDANGEAALSQNITAKEFIKATQQLDLLTKNNVPFTLAQVKPLIYNILEQDRYRNASDVTKIVFVQGSPSIYKVYTKQGGNNYWTVDANTGYAHG